MIEVNLMKQSDLRDLNVKYDSKFALESGKLVFVIREDEELAGYSVVETKENDAHIKKYFCELKESIENLFCLKSIGSILTNFEITDIYDDTENINKFFRNDGKLDLSELFRSSCNDI
ncbi:MAG: hypothetical protein SPI59_01720 [Finegoldia sp.]|nr:hypothetical protein [Finegoldia sp.]